jgi:TolA-binding protein
VGEAFLEQGKAEEAGGNYTAAVQSFRAGIDSIGDLYSHAKLLDDTGVKLVLAESNESKGNLKGAAAVYERVLESRLHAYAVKFGLK